MKLAIVTQDPSNRGGVLRLVEYVYDRALAAGLEPHVLHYGKFSEHAGLSVSPLNLTRGELNLRVGTRSYDYEGMETTAIGAYLPEFEIRRLEANRAWRRELSKYDAAILVTGSAHTGLPLVQCHTPFAAWISSTIEDDRRERLAKDASASARLERAGLTKVKLAERSVLEAANPLLAVSEDTAGKLAAITESLPEASRPEVWPYPVDTDRYRPLGILRLPRILFVGRANDPRKRFPLFLEACERLRTLKPELGFEVGVVSSGSLELRTDLLLRQYDGLTDEALVRLYSPSSVLVSTSEQEGLGIAMMEAMACGLPVVSTRSGGPETYLEDGRSGFFVDATAEAIAARLAELLTDAALRDSLGARARERIESAFSARTWDPRFEELLLTLAAPVRSPQ